MSVEKTGLLADIMADNNQDEKNTQKPKTPQTPFGGWASTSPNPRPEGEQNGAPRAVVSNADGSQRPAKEQDLSSPKYGAAAKNSPAASNEPPKVKSFSDTFGVVAKKEEGIPLPAVSGSMEDDDDDFTPPLQEKPEESSEDEVADETNNEVAAKVSTSEDPFAWTPDEAPSNNEPRRNLASGESWMQANTSYEELQSSTRAALHAAEHPASEQVVIEEVTPTINPYTFNKGEEWTAPPMDADSLSSSETEDGGAPITEGEKLSFEFSAPEPQADETPEEDETQSLSPFNFTPYSEDNVAEAPTNTAEIAAPDMPMTSASPFISPDEGQTAPPSSMPQPQATEAPAASRTNFQAYKSAATPSAPPQEQPAPQPEVEAPSEPDTISEALPEDVSAIPDSTQDIPLPESYTPPSAEESTLPEQTDIWNTPEAQASPPQENNTSETGDQAARTAMDAGENFGGGAGEQPEGILATAQADIPAEQQDFASPSTEPASQDYPPAEPAVNTAPVNNSHTPEEIQAILQGHTLWLNSGGKNGRRANFRNADLQQCDLSNSHLAEASFRGANLTGVNFSGSDMRGADMSEAQLYGANFSAVSLIGAIFSRTDLRNAVFERADLQAADFNGAFLTGAVLSGLNLSGAVLLDADLQSADLSQASLIGANLRGANLTYANLAAANLSNANCRDVRFEQAILDGAVFEGANLKNASVQGASLLGTDLSSAGEITPEQRQETIQAEKEQLLQEWQRLKEHEAQIQHLQSSIQQREMALQTDRVNAERSRRDTLAQYESLEKLIGKTHEVMRRHRVHDRRFKYFGVSWFIFTILIAVAVMMFINALELNELDWLELSIVFGGCALIMGLFIATTVRSIKLSNNLKQLLDMYEQQLPPSDKTGH